MNGYSYNVVTNPPPAYSNTFVAPTSIKIIRAGQPAHLARTLAVTASQELGEIKKKIQSVLKITDAIKLVHEGKQLQPDNATLITLRVGDGETVHVVVSNPAGSYKPVGAGYQAKPTTDAELFDSIRKVNKYNYSTVEFRQSMSRALKLSLEVLKDEYTGTATELTVNDVLAFIGEPLEGNSSSLLTWIVEQYLEKECAGKIYGYMADKEKKVNETLQVLLGAIRLIDWDIRQNNDQQYTAVLQNILNPDMMWYKGKFEKMGMSNQWKEGTPEHVDAVRSLVDELQTIELVRNLLPEGDISARNDWQATEFDIHIAVMRTKLKTSIGAEREAIATELKTLVQGMLDSRLQELDGLRAAATEADGRLAAAIDAHKLDSSNDNKTAVVAAKKDAEAKRKQANCMVGSAGVCTLLADNKEAFDEEQFTAALESVLQVLMQCTVADATNFKWENDDVPAFSAVFDKLSTLAVLPGDKQKAFMAQLHCVLQCWRTDRVPMHQFALKKLQHLGTTEVHRTRSVKGPGVGEITYDMWDNNWKNREKFEILEIISQEGESENPNRIKYTSTYVIQHVPKFDMYKLRIEWQNTGKIETKILPFSKYHTHKEELEGSALSPKAFHQWIDESKFFEELFGVRYNAFLLNSEGKAFIEYLAKHNQLAPHHAAGMLGKMASARTQHERDEVKNLILTLLNDMEAAGQVSVLETVGSTLEPTSAAGLLLEKNDFWWGRAMSDYTASMAFMQCCLAVLEKLPPPYDLVDPLNSLCVEVMAYADNHRSNDAESQQGDPLRVEVVKQSVDRVAAVLSAPADQIETAFAASRASAGLLHKVLNRVMANPTEFGELLDILASCAPDGTQIVSLCIQEMNTVAKNLDSTEHIASRLGPRLALIKLLVNNGNMVDLLLVQDMESLLATFADLNHIEMLLEWFAQLKVNGHPEKQQLTSMIFNQAAKPGQLVSSQGFQGFKQLFLTVNAHALDSNSVEGAEAITKELGGCITSLEDMVGIPALWGMVLHGNEIVAEAAQSLILKIYFSLTLSVDHTHNALLDAVFNILQPDSAGTAEDSQIHEVQVTSFLDGPKYGTKCKRAGGDTSMVWHSTAQWELFLQQESSLAGVDLSSEPTGVCQALNDKVKALLSSNYADTLVFLNSGDGELNRKPSTEVVAECDKAQVTLRLLEVLLAAVGATSEEQRLPGHRYSSRGEQLSVDVKGELWQVGSYGQAAWKDLQGVTITTHTTATVATLKARALAAHSVPHVDKMECVLSTGTGKPIKNSASLLQAGFNNVNREAVVKMFPAMHVQRNVTGAEKMSLPSIGDAMTQSVKYYRVIFDILASASAQASTNEQQHNVMQKAWQLLELLPRSAVADKALENPDERDWSCDLSTTGDVNSTAAWQAVYNVQSINSKLRPAQVGDEPGLAEAGLRWRRAFLGAGGFSAVNKLLEELASAGGAHSVQLGLAPIVQVLEYCIEGANRPSSDTESPVSSPNPAGLNRAFSSASQESVKAVDHVKLLEVLLQLVTCDLYSEQRTHLIRALSAVASSSIELADKLLTDAGPLIKQLLVNESPVICEATASLLMSMCSNFDSSEMLSAVLDITTAAMIQAISNGKAENCQFALGLLLDVVGSNQQQELEHQHAEKMAALLKQSFAEMQAKGEQPSTEWLKLLGCLACKISPQVLDELDLTNFIWDQLYTGTNNNDDAHAATVQALLQVARTPSGLLELTTRMMALQEPTIKSCKEDSEFLKSYWFIDPEETGKIRSSKGTYGGLNNQGATCYQNSTLQQIFMHPHLRESILSAQPSETPDTEALQSNVTELKKTSATDPAAKEALSKAEAALQDSKDLAARIALFKEVQKVFASLKYGVTHAYNPSSFVKQASKDSLFPFDVYAQQDASEFYSVLVQRLEEAFKGTEGGFKVFEEQTFLKTQWRWDAKYNDAPVTRMGGPGEYVGILSQISLLDDTGQVVNSLDEALALKLGKPEAMDGIQWDTLADQSPDGKAPSLNSTRTQLITYAPATLCFMLNRFNPFTMEKLNDRFEFGHDLNLSDYLTPEAKEEGQNGNYKLGGIVIQSGSAQSGHYYSYIRDRATGDWNEFNDKKVAPWNPEEQMSGDCFGGEQKEKYTNAQGTTTFRASGNWKTAYMLIYDRDDPELSQPVNMDMSDEVKESWGSLITENEEATAKALVCNLPHMQLLLELMNANHEPTAELLQSMLAMAIPFFFSVVVRLGASKAQSYSYSGVTSYGSSGVGSSNYYNSIGTGSVSGFGSYTGSNYNTGSTVYSSSYGTSSYGSKPLEPEENEQLDELLWQWGYMLGALIGQCELSEIVKLLEEHEESITGALLACPRESTRKSISRMLLRIASVGPAQALLVYNNLMGMLSSCSKMAPNDQLEVFSATLRRMLQMDPVREHARSCEGAARVLNALIMANPLTFNDFNDINEADPDGSECKKPLGKHAGLAMKAPELCDTVCELLIPVEGLPPVSARLAEHPTVLKELQNYGSARGKVLLLSAGLVGGGEAAGRKVINDTISDLAPAYCNTQNEIKKRTAREAIPSLLTVEYGDILMESLMRKAAELMNPPKTVWNPTREADMKKSALELLEFVLELSSKELAQRWLQNNREMWEPMASTLHLSDPSHRVALAKLLQGDGEDVGAENGEQVLVSTVHEQLKAHGEYFNGKRHWCQKAITALGLCDPPTAVNWVMGHEVELSRADKAVSGPIAGADAEDRSGVPEVDAEALISSWQTMVDKELFAAAENGDSKLDLMAQWLEWGANIESRHLSRRTPLHNAARNGEADAVKFLIEYGCDVNPETDGWTPLHNACNNHNPHGYPNCLETIRNLLQGKADINRKIAGVGGWSGRTPLDICTLANKKDAEEILNLYM